MYKIFFVDMAKATGVKEMGKRPVVSVKSEGNFCYVYKITSRMRPDFRHIKMNNYIVHGFCDIEKCYKIHKKHIINYMRDCTTSEFESIYLGAKSVSMNAVV